MRAVALICSGIVFASGVAANTDLTEENVTFTTETFSLPELLSHLEGAVSELISADEKNYQFAYHELKEGLKIVYAFSWLCPKEAATILQALDECYAALADAIDRYPSNDPILRRGLSLFPSGRNYEHEILAAQPSCDWTEALTSNKLKSTIDTADADLIWIQDGVSSNFQEDTLMIGIPCPSYLFYSRPPSQHVSSKILVIKHRSDDSPEYAGRGGVRWKLGGKDHGKSSLYFEGEIKDKNGNYAKGRISKESGDDGYECDVEAGKEKRK